MEIVGRTQEIDLINNCYESDRAELIIVYGRRRVGKTFLVQQAFDNKFDFYITGIYKKDRRQQLQNFANVLSNYSGEEVAVPQNWVEAFAMLRRYIVNSGKEKFVCFFDELPWMDSSRSDLVSALENFWNGWGASQSCLKMVLCGSATSWITNKIFQNKGGLFNRDTLRLFLKPFTLKETEDFCKSKLIGYSRYDIALCYMVLGGIPYYLNRLQKGLSVAQNIDNLFFKRGGSLENEFSFLYSSLFSKPESYIKVVELLSQKKKGYTLADISKHSGIGLGGNLSKILSDLENCNMVMISVSYGAEKKETLYQLCDFYTLFYFKYIKGNDTKDEHYWEARQNTAEITAWKGFAFELLCQTHIEQIRRALGIAGVGIEVSTFNHKGGATDKGAQIDLVIDRKDKVTNLCEIKFASDEFEITKQYEESLRHKIEVYAKHCKQRRSLMLTMITTYGVKRNAHSGIVMGEVGMDGLFG